MDAESIGGTIAALRRKGGMTQVQLAERLSVSDKTVSKWESGGGYPGITQLPELARLFGVTVDYLLSGRLKGITVAGNILVDLVKNINCYPECGMLSSIIGVTRAVGGCVPNTAISLARIDRTLPVSALGRIGDDEHGRYIVAELMRCGIDTAGIRVSAEGHTGFSDVMSLPGGERTIFHSRGTNAEFSAADIELATLNCSIFHIGYILLLDQFDKPDDEYGTVMARFLRNVQQKGIKTSVDVVSSTGSDYAAKILPALKYCNYAIVNEIESCCIWGIPPRDEDGALIVDNIRMAMQGMLNAGVKDKVIVHSKERAFCLDADGKFTGIASLRLPESQIKGSVGAGDAFCAGCLYMLYKGCGSTEMLEFASGAAAASLRAENSVDGICSSGEIIEMLAEYPRQDFRR